MSYRHFGDFVEHFARFDDRLALTIRPFIKIERTTYKELQKRVYQTAHYLSAKGIGSGDRLMIIGPNSPQWVEVFLGAQLLGVAVVPVDARSNLETTLSYAKQTKPTLVFRSTYLLPELDTHVETNLLEELDEHISTYAPLAPTHQPRGNETALIVFTSGTTADPKGVVLSQANVLANVEGVQQALTISPDWRFLSVLPLSHMYELTGGCLVELSSGASIFYLPRVTPLAIARGLQDYHITTILTVPQLLTLFLQRIRQTAVARGQGKTLAILLMLAPAVPFSGRRILFHRVHKKLGGRLDIVVTGGAPIPIEVATTWERMGVRMVQGYGLTETAPVLTFNRPDNRRLDSLGQALDSVRLRINKEDGEIQAKGPSVFNQYWHNEPATRAAFTPDGWFKTGDIGLLRDGWLQIQGRAKFAIVLSSGLKVFPEDIELVADKDPTLKAICIVGVKQTDGEAVHAVIISDGSDAQVSKTISEINAQLESFQHISDWKRWPEPDFPRTRLLKIDRKRVQIWANAQTASEHDVPTDTPTPENDPLIDIIRLVLEKPRARIKETDRLADIGLDSLRRLSVVSLIEEQLSVTIAETQITQATTLAHLRKLITQGSPAEPPMHRATWPFWPWVRTLGTAIRETLARGLLRIWVRQRTEGNRQLADLTGPALYIFNHVDDFDVPVVYQGLPWRIRKRLAVAQADDVQRGHKILAFVSRFGYAAFSFARSEPFMPSLEYVGQLIDQGWNVALAPEGRLSTDGTLLPFKSGIGLLAVELGVPVVPIKTVGLSGTVPIHAKWPKKHSKVTVRIGKPVYFARGTDYDEATKQLHRDMEEL
jgi:long-chain acyl-CoA synthetase